MKPLLTYLIFSISTSTLSAQIDTVRGTEFQLKGTPL